MEDETPATTSFLLLWDIFKKIMMKPAFIYSLKLKDVPLKA